MSQSGGQGVLKSVSPYAALHMVVIDSLSALDMLQGIKTQAIESGICRVSAQCFHGTKHKHLLKVWPHSLTRLCKENQVLFMCGTLSVPFNVPLSVSRMQIPVRI